MLSQFDPQLGVKSAEVLAYGSKALSDAERKYDPYRRELLAIVFFTEQFRYYLDGKQFVVRTDHRPLEWLKTHKTLTGQLARCSIKL